MDPIRFGSTLAPNQAQIDRSRYIRSLNLLENTLQDFVDSKKIDSKKMGEVFDAYFITKRGLENKMIPPDLYIADDLKAVRKSVVDPIVIGSARRLSTFGKLEERFREWQEQRPDEPTPKMAVEKMANLREQFRTLGTVDQLDQPGYESAKEIMQWYLTPLEK